MITAQDIQEAIAYYNGKVEPSPQDAIMLAACFTLQDHMFPQGQADPQAYSLAAEPTDIQYKYSGASAETIGEYGESDFLIAISGKAPAAIWAIIDDLMSVLKVNYKRVYDHVMREVRKTD